MKSPSMNHANVELLLADYRDLRGVERREVEQHVASCPSCASRLAEYQAMDVELQGLRDAWPGPGLRAGYYAALHAQPSAPVARRAPARRPSWFYGFASIAAVIVLVVAFWTILRPGNGFGYPRSQGGVEHSLATTTPVADARLGAIAPAPTAQPIVLQTAASTPDPRLVFHPGWDLIEKELSRAVLGAQVPNRVCDWLVLGAEGRSFYIWTYCAAYLNAPNVTAASMPAVLTVSDDGTGVTVQTPRDGTYYPEDVRSLFPPAIQQQIFDRSFDPALAKREQHEKLRLKWSGLPPAGANETAPVDPNQPTAGATVRNFSGRPDPAWTLTYRELEELDRLLLGLSTGQCPSLPDQLGYRGVAVSLGMEPAGTLIAAEGFVRSGDTGTTSDAICLSDPERSVERFLLSSAHANVGEDLNPLMGQLLQPVPTPLVTPSAAPTIQAGWIGYGNERLDIQFAHPEKWEVGTKTDWSRVFRTKTDAPTDNPIEPPPFWFTVLPPGFKNEDFSAYNWWSDEELALAWNTAIGETLASRHAPDGYNTYTRLANRTVGGFPATALNNPAMWGAQKGVQERRVLVKVGGVTVMFGTYYRTGDDLQTFEQVLGSVKFGSLMFARGAAFSTPVSEPAATPTPR